MTQKAFFSPCVQIKMVLIIFLNDITRNLRRNKTFSSLVYTIYIYIHTIYTIETGLTQNTLFCPQRGIHFNENSTVRQSTDIFSRVFHRKRWSWASLCSITYIHLFQRVKLLVLAWHNVTLSIEFSGAHWFYIGNVPKIFQNSHSTKL